MVRKLYSLLSGGIDSTLATLKRIQDKKDFIEFQPIFLDYGQKARNEEWKAVCNISKELPSIIKDTAVRIEKPKRILLAENVEKQNRIFGWSKCQLIQGNFGPDPCLENRNMILLSIAASFIESQMSRGEVSVLVTGFRDEYVDTTVQFVKLMNEIFAYLLNENDKTIIIETPIIGYGKDGKGKLLEDFRNFKRIIDMTWSCYQPKDGQPCHQCGACIDREASLERLTKNASN